ncbi:hypothetical protein PybrP1_012554 [[Pythium] brassicae (nom. inval.)]|nr:hypothetical protein PybrP1_012554 [[Pythium] brassicae (nom. inval.)]
MKKASKRSAEAPPAVRDAKRSRAVSAGAASFASLPRPLFARVLAFALPNFVPVTHSAPLAPNLPLRRIRPIASVARAWTRAARGVVQDYAVGTLDWRMPAAPSEDDVAQLRSELAGRGEWLLDLRLTIDAHVRSKDLAGVDWAELLSLVPELQRLDLRGVPLEHSAMARILLAASTVCGNVEALVLSTRSAPSKNPMEAIATTYNALCEALENWNARTAKGRDGGGRSSGRRRASGGLRQLTIPGRRDDEAEAPSATLLAVVAEFCPSLEFFDGWKVGYRVDSFVECDEKWYVPPAVWTQFCETTGRALREFNWVVAPFHDVYFRAFAAAPKPNLRKLCLTVSESWSWEDFRLQGRDDDNEEELDLPEVLVAPPTPDTLAALVDALPRLEQLHVILHSNLDEPGTFDAEAFGDAFLASVAGSCPLLQELKIVELSTEEGLTGVESISGDGLLALSRMANLQDIVITGAGGSPLNVAAFVEHWQHTRGQRTVDIAVDQGESERAFYDEALDLLEKILEVFGADEDGDETSLSPSKFVVQIRNLTTAPDFKPKSLKTFCKALNKLVRKIEATLPWVRVAFESDGVLEEGPVSALSTVGRVVVSSRDANVGVLEELSALAPVASAAAKSKSHRQPHSKRTNAHSSQEVSNSSESDNASDYGSVVDEQSESSAAGTNSEEESEFDSPAKPKRRQDAGSASESDASETSEEDTPVKKRRGRPRRQTSESEFSSVEESERSAEDDSIDFVSVASD